MIALATVDDLKQVADLGKQFYLKLHQADRFHFKAFLAAWTQYLATGFGLIVKRTSDHEVKEAVGMLFYDDPNDGAKSAANVFWYVSDDESSLASGLVYDRLEKEVRARGTVRMFMSNLVGERFEQVGNFLFHAGYVPVESHHRKDLWLKQSL